MDANIGAHANIDNHHEAKAHSHASKKLKWRSVRVNVHLSRGNIKLKLHLSSPSSHASSESSISISNNFPTSTLYDGYNLRDFPERRDGEDSDADDDIQEDTDENINTPDKEYWIRGLVGGLAKAAKIWCINVTDLKVANDQQLVDISSVVRHSDASDVPTPGP
ncbi:hypothetical protein COCMIDRAFT_2511 [Bipolaris oryzae ATCC 44560]|uniref:Uncharacterized protein n=1 Tax=Bipolaris oryzae ATCC 44560 TaxID=930090 RepID=W6ZM74_COCMI|nr:uncharacterized protein COCMIDRAFT_2511 [Bipolaris oryzae ATCC 44560]EUC48649.1 hypothetical protein COCMIDRAFT_2511 [Bipolaris oryzae ATCC 44560]